MDIAIVGAGLAGLTAAYDLVRSGIRPTVFDAAAESGGQIRTQRERGFVIEHGAEGFVAADTAVPRLCRELGIADQIIPQLVTRSLLYANGSLTELSSREAAVILGIPTTGETGPRGISALRGGMGTLIDALIDAVRDGADVRLRHSVRSFERNGSQWLVRLSDGRTALATGIILAVPPPAAAALLAPLDPESAALLREITLNSNLSVTLAYSRAAVRHALDASGLVVTSGEAPANGLRACVFSSSKFAGRAPEGTVLLRAFYRPDGEAIDAADAAWVKRATDFLDPVLGISAPPSDSWVSRWPDAIPEAPRYDGKLLSQLELNVRGPGRVVLAGSAYETGGIPGAVQSGRAAAQRLAGSLPA